MTNGMITNYELQYRISFSDSPYMALNGTSLIRTVNDLDPSTPYDFRVRAYTRVGPGPYTNVVMNGTTCKFLIISSFIMLAYMYVVIIY